MITRRLSVVCVVKWLVLMTLCVWQNLKTLKWLVGTLTSRLGPQTPYTRCVTRRRTTLDEVATIPQQPSEEPICVVTLLENGVSMLMVISMLLGLW